MKMKTKYEVKIIYKKIALKWECSKGELWTARSSDTQRIRCLINETSSEKTPKGTS